MSAPLEGNDALFERGLEIRREVVGAEYVDRSLAAAEQDTFTAPLQRLITEYCWGAVWARDGLDRRTRSLLNIVMITALNRPNELRLHVRGAINNGVTEDEVAEALLQAAIYCGVPAALDAFRIARQALDDLKAEGAST